MLVLEWVLELALGVGVGVGFGVGVGNSELSDQYVFVLELG